VKRVVVVKHPVDERAEAAWEHAKRVFETHGWVTAEEIAAGEAVDLVLVLGGDGTLLRAAELVRGIDPPLLAVNVGHLGFLAECDLEDLDRAIALVIAGKYDVDARATLGVAVTGADGMTWRGWALNEVTLEKVTPQRMVDLLVEVDDRPVTAFGCDGMLISTSTGSTGHAYSGGGPVVWPEVRAMLALPLAAHALFTRPLVVPQTSTVTLRLSATSRGAGQVSCDGRRIVPLAPGGHLVVRHSARPVNLVRFNAEPFADRLVKKFSLPVHSWRDGPGGQTW
jgi:NAD+ kinase